jgi:hypothetical protein
MTILMILIREDSKDLFLKKKVIILYIVLFRKSIKYFYKKYSEITKIKFDLSIKTLNKKQSINYNELHSAIL